MSSQQASQDSFDAPMPGATPWPRTAIDDYDSDDSFDAPVPGAIPRPVINQHGSGPLKPTPKAADVTPNRHYPNTNEKDEKRKTQEVDQATKNPKTGDEVFEKNHFPTPEEMAFFVENVEMSSTPRCKHTNTVYSTLEPTRILFTGLKKPENWQNSQNHMSKVVDIFIRRVIEITEGDLETSKYWFKLGHRKYAGDQRFHVTHKSYADADGQEVINILTERMQSDPEIQLHQCFYITMCVIKYSKTSYTQNEILDAFFAVKNNRVVGDTHSLPKALALGRLNFDLTFGKSAEEERKLTEKLYKLTGAASDQNREQLQIIEAEKLLIASGLNTDQKEHGRKELAVLATYLSDYQIHLWDVNIALPTTRRYVEPFIHPDNRGYVIFNPDAKKFIGLMYHGNHYEYVTEVKLPRPARFCYNCFEFGRNSAKCSAKCLRCGREDQESEPRVINCVECHSTFHSQQCYDTHKMKTGAYNALSLCEKYFRCQKCGLVDRRDNYGGLRHVCNPKPYCYVCCRNAEPGHVCSPYVRKRKLDGETFPSLTVKLGCFMW